MLTRHQTTRAARPVTHRLCAFTALSAVISTHVAASAAFAIDLEGVEARIFTASTAIQPGEPIFVEFTLRNTTDSPVVLSVPGTSPQPVSSVTGLPLAHVFSGDAFTGLIIKGDFGRTWVDAIGYHPPGEVPEVVLAPHGVVGTRVDITEFYDIFQTPGLYRLVWEPYGGALQSNQLTLDVAPRKQAVIITDEGTMTVEFDYERAPNHVANFIELAQQGFYNQKLIHRIEPGYFLQTGSPSGDRTGIRPDGKRIRAEFSDHPFDRGTVGMARLESDPDSASSQFIIVNTRIPQWDGRYTAFGELVGEESFKTLDKLMQTPVDETGRPEHSVYLRAVRIVNAPTNEVGQSLVGGQSDW